MTHDLLKTLRWQFDLHWSLAEFHLPALTDELCLWEPSRNSWTVRRDASNRWRPDFSESEPEPIPTVTAAWVTWQILWWWSGALATVRGEMPRAHAEVDWPGSADATKVHLEKLSQEWKEALDSLSDSDLQKEVFYLRTESQPMWQLIAWVNSELMKNIAELGYIRFLFGASQNAR